MLLIIVIADASGENSSFFFFYKVVSPDILNLAKPLSDGGFLRSSDDIERNAVISLPHSRSNHPSSSTTSLLFSEGPNTLVSKWIDNIVLLLLEELNDQPFPPPCSPIIPTFYLLFTSSSPTPLQPRYDS